MGKSQKSRKTGKGQVGGNQGRSSKRRQKKLHSGDQRSLKKLRVANSSIVEQKTRESFARKQQLKRKLQFSKLHRSLEREENRLRHWNPLDRNPDPKPKKKEYQLKGAARPAWQVYPELYPEIHAEIERKNRRQEKDLFEEQLGKFSENMETREYLTSTVQLAFLSKMDGQAEKSAESFFELLKLDEKDALGARVGLISAYLDTGAVDKAESLLETEMEWWKGKDSEIPADLLFTKVVVQYVSNVLLKCDNDAEEEDRVMDDTDSSPADLTKTSKGEQVKESECGDGILASSEEGRNPIDRYIELADLHCIDALREAIMANPYIAEALVKSEALETVIDPVAVDDIVSEMRNMQLKQFHDLENPLENPIDDRFRTSCLCTAGAVQEGTPEQAVLYFVQELSCWRDVEGLLEWLGYVLEDLLDKELVSLDSELEPVEEDHARRLRKMYEEGLEQWMLDATAELEEGAEDDSDP